MFKGMSLNKKLFLSCIPMAVGILLVAYAIKNTAEVKNSEGERAIQMVKAVNNAELEMVKMSEALRGYLINPANEKEAEKKKAADAAYAEQAEVLAKLLTDAPEILALNEKMAQYDATDLDKMENLVMGLIEKKDPGASAAYTQQYGPARSIQSENFFKLKGMVEVKAAAILAEIEAQKVRSAHLYILLMFLSVGLGTGIMMWIAVSAANKVTAITGMISEVSLQLDGASKQIAAGAQELSQATSEQSSSLEETSSAIDETNSMVKKNSENARNASTTSIESQKKAEQGKQVVERMIQSMEGINASNDAIKTQIDRSNEQMREIVKVIEEIGTKTKVINDIVFQTKLLSFNASVEAARAGEHGKGFSVVAEEVGNLAQMSGNAAKEITTMLDGSIQRVQSIVEQTKSSVEGLMADGKEKVAAGTNVARECAEVLNEIVANVNSVAQMASEISSASEEQSQGIQEITKAMGQLDQITQQNAASSDESARSAEELSAQAGRMKSYVQELAAAIQGASASYAMEQFEEVENVVPIKKAPAKRKVS